jgi:hypothetical protein
MFHKLLVAKGLVGARRFDQRKVQIFGPYLLLLLSGRPQRAVFFRRRCSLAFMTSFMSAAGRISKMLP